MKIAFVYVDPSYQVMAPFHLGIASLIAYLRQGGHECQFFHLMGDVAEGEYIDFLKENRPDVVAFSITTNIFPYISPMASLTKRHSEAFTICGGIHATLMPEEVIAIDGIDALCIGEGEETLLELCDNLSAGKEISGIANLWVKRDGKIHRNPLRPLVEDLDSLPFLDREVFPYMNCFDLGFMRRGVFMASRGCPYNCAYCCSSAVKQLYGGDKYVRFRSVEHVIEEVEMVTRNFPDIEYQVFHDDLLPMRKEWFEDFTREYRKRVKLSFEMNCHPSLMDREIARLAKEAGCTIIRFGIESGNDHIRRKVLDRHVSNRRIKEAFSFCDEVGIKTLSYNMLGLPFEGRSQILDTIKLNAQVKPEVTHVSIFYPFPGTKAYEMCKREGFLTEKYFDSFYEDTILELKDTSSVQLKALRRRFDFFVRLYSRCYRMPSFISKVLEKIVDLGILAATNRRVLQAPRWFKQPVAKGTQHEFTGPCYTIEEGKVRVWGAE